MRIMADNDVIGAVQAVRKLVENIEALRGAGRLFIP